MLRSSPCFNANKTQRRPEPSPSTVAAEEEEQVHHPIGGDTHRRHGGTLACGWTTGSLNIMRPPPQRRPAETNLHTYPAHSHSEPSCWCCFLIPSYPHTPIPRHLLDSILHTSRRRTGQGQCLRLRAVFCCITLLWR